MIIGIDPGLHGGLAVLDKEGALKHLFDMPIFPVKKGKSTKYDYDVVELYKMISKVSSSDSKVFVEKTQGLPSGYGVQASWWLGKCEGLLEGVLVTLKLSYEFVKPQVWQKHFGITRTKGDKKAQSFRIASQLFPSAELKTSRGRKLDGRSDALLIAEWGRRRLQGVLS